MWFVMSRKCSDQFYYAVRIGWKPGIYRGWYGEYGAEKQITGIRNYDYSNGYLKTSSWEDADAYMRAHELFSVESDFTIKKFPSKKICQWSMGRHTLPRRRRQRSRLQRQRRKTPFFLHLLWTRCLPCGQSENGTSITQISTLLLRCLPCIPPRDRNTTK